MRQATRTRGKRRTHPFAGPLIAAVVAAGLLLGIGAVALHESDQALTHDAQQRVESNRDAAIRAVVRQSTDLKRTIATYAAETTISTGLAHPSDATLAAAQEQIAVLARSKGAPAVILSDLRGRNVAVFPPRPELLGMDFSFRDWFKGAQRTGKPYVSSGYRSIAVGNPLAVGISTPVLSAGRRVGYLTLVGKLDQVRSVADGARQDDGVVITVTDQIGHRLTSALPVDDRGQPLRSSVDRGAREALAGRGVSFLTDHELASAAPVPGVGWTVTASLPTAVALAPLRAFHKSLGLAFGGALLLLVLCTGLALRLTRRSAKEQDVIEVERARLATLFAASPIGILECTPDTTILTINDALATMLGYQPHELIGTCGKDLVEPEVLPQVDADLTAVLSSEVDSYTRDRLYRAKDGSHVPAQVSAIVVKDEEGAVRRVVAFVTDQRGQRRIEDALRASEDRLTELALHDDLTGLANRRLLLDRCTAAFATARHGGVAGTSVAALFIDLDGFKPVNDLQGHENGDQVLADIAASLVDVVRPTDTVARVGGDEFVILLGQYDGLAHLHDIAERVTRAVRREVTDGRTTLSVTASVGVASIDLAIEPMAHPDHLLSRADTAMYRAKERGRDRHDVFEPGLQVVNGLAELPTPRAMLY